MTVKRQTKTTKPGERSKVIPHTMTENNQAATSVSMQDLLGDKLRAYYNEVALEPVPDRFDKLLKQLEARSNPKKSS